MIESIVVIGVYCVACSWIELRSYITGLSSEDELLGWAPKVYYWIELRRWITELSSESVLLDWTRKVYYCLSSKSITGLSSKNVFVIMVSHKTPHSAVTLHIISKWIVLLLCTELICFEELFIPTYQTKSGYIHD